MGGLDEKAASRRDCIMIRAESGLVGMGKKLLLRVLKAYLVRKAGSMVSRFSSGTDEYWMEYCGSSPVLQ